MRYFKTQLFALAMAALPLGAAAQAIEGAPDGYKLVWSDEFNGTALNEKNWNIEVSGAGGGNQELQYYRRENVSVADGNLVLTARRENFEGKAFTSGRINSNQKAAFKHGIMQAKIKFPKTANGLWPAYWMMGNDINKYGWPRCGEIDIVEMGHYNGINWGLQDRYFSGTLHYGPSASNEDHQMKSQEFTRDQFNAMSPVEDEYHIFTVEWDGDYIYMYYDLEKYTNAKKRVACYYTLNITASTDKYAPGTYFQKPFYFLFNLAVGGTFTNIYNPNGISALPNAGDEAKMYVDWVRVYQADDDADRQYTYVDENGDVQTNIEEEPEPQPQDDDATELSGFATEALDAEGNPNFNFSDCEDVVLISTSQGVTGHFLSESNVLKDYNVNNTNRNLYIWENTYMAVNRDGMANSFGWEEGYNMFMVPAGKSWSGLGFHLSGEDLSMIDDTYWLHFGMKGTDLDMHTSHEMQVGNAKFRVGLSDGTLASIGDFKRDGKWYFFDIPVKALRQFATKLFANNGADDNVIAFLSGGKAEAELCFDNIFFYKSKTKEIPTYKDTSADLGKYGYKSVDEEGNSVFKLDEVEEMIPLSLSEDMWRAVTGDGNYPDDALVKADRDYTQSNNYYPWEGTMVGELNPNLKNSTGIYTGGVTEWASTTVLNWNGMGIATGTQKDLSMIDDSYYLHVSLRSSAAVGHIPVRMAFGAADADAGLVFGAYSKSPIFADFNRDGEWYSYDIPVAELKKYGKLWSTSNNGKLNIDDNLICFYTMPTLYDGSSFSFDNIFFWKKKGGEAPVVSELGDYGYKSLDAQGKTAFSFEDKEFINFNVPQATIEMQTEGMTQEEKILAGYYTLNNWEGDTYTNGSKSGEVANSFGVTNQGWIDWVVGTKGWSGGGFISEDGADLSELDNGDWYLHFAMRGTDNCNHLIGLGESRFTIGSAPFDDKTPVIGNYKRDNEWYSFDIPYSVFKKTFPSLFVGSGSQKSWTGNLVWFMSGGVTGMELQLDNVFLWREKIDTGISKTSAVSKTVGPMGIFDLSGRKVQNMNRPGIYIIRTADGVKKVMKK